MTMDNSGNPPEGQPNWAKLFSEVPDIQYEVCGSWPHDPTAFTEGLVFYDGTLYESTGKGPGHCTISTLRQVMISNGRTLRCRALRHQYFGEGLTIFQGKIFQLTETSNKGFIYDLDTFNLLDTFYYEYQGWGLTHDDKYLIMSNGSNQLQLIDPDTLDKQDVTIDVKIGGHPLRGLNELEYIKGSIYANVLKTDYIFSIDPTNGEVRGRLDLRCLRPAETRDCADCVLNGIAYDEESEHLFVTGKNWPTVFEISLASEEAQRLA